MKYTMYTTMLLMLFSCSQSTDNGKAQQNRIDSLESKLTNVYTPGFGEFMSSIQAHHAKLWFAGQYQNWQLADFELHEIEEALVKIQKFNTERPESKDIKMINPAMDSIKNAIQQKNPILFKNSFVLLTNTCNSCHKATQHEFIRVTVPAALPVVNQDFKPVQ